MSKITISFKWNRRDRAVPKSKNLPIECILRHEGKEKIFQLKAYQIKKSQWHEDKQSVKKHDDAIAINEKLLSFVALTKQYQSECFNSSLTVDLNTLKSYILNGRGAKDDFIIFIEEEIRKEETRAQNAKKSGLKRKGVKSDSTIEKYKSMLLWLKEYKETITYSEINIPLLEGFIDFLSTSHNKNYKTKKVLLSANSISAILRSLKTFINLADRAEKLTKRNPCKFVSVGGEVGRKNPLTYEQVMKIYDFDCAKIKNAKGNFISAKKVEQYTKKKECFVFQCLTGLSSVDFFRMTRSNLEEKNGTTWLVSTRQKVEWKSNKPFRVPISDIFDGLPYAIWKKHGRLKLGDNTPIFDKLDGKRYNEAIRLICQYCGIFEHVRIKDARDTFAKLSRMLENVNERMVSKMMGHSTLKQTDEYGSDSIVDEWEAREAG